MVFSTCSSPAWTILAVPNTILYRNDGLIGGVWVFTDSGIILAQVGSGAGVWGDYQQRRLARYRPDGQVGDVSGL